MMLKASVALLAITLRLSGEDVRWPQYRGPVGAGISESAAPVEFGPKQNLEWEGVMSLISQSLAMPHGLLAIRLGGENDVTQANVAWSEQRAVPEVPVPLVYGERVYAVTNGGIVSVLDQASGKLIYRGRLGAGGLYYSSPIAAAGNVYFASSEGVVTVVRAGGKLDVVARNDLGEPIFATPAVVQGRLYVRTTGHLYAFGR
ncbi:MAG: PQQ-like beta-propeller repeat protein [Acidobacteria bacterium]|nr:PQQ-like beta-propeller repeat protein [Acidobacteriota bacterium]